MAVKIRRLRNPSAKLGSAMVLLLIAVPSLGHAYERPFELERVDVPQQGGDDKGYGWETSLSKDGRFVAVVTNAALHMIDTNLNYDVYVRDMKRGTTELISQSPEGLPAIGESMHPAITPDGRFVAFASGAINLVPGDTNGLEDVFVFDRATGTMEIVSIDDHDEQAVPGTTCGPLRLGKCSWGPSISANGQFVSFTSEAPLVDDDTNAGPDIFIRDRSNDQTVRASLDSDGRESTSCRQGSVVQLLADPESILRAPECPLAAKWGASLSANARYVAFESLASDLVEGDTNRTWDVFVRDLDNGTTERVSVASDGSEAMDPQWPLPPQWWSGSTLHEMRQVLSEDGRFVTFTSIASNLVPNDGNRFPGDSIGRDVFVHDRKTGRTERVSVTPTGAEIGRMPGAGKSYGAAWSTISANGRFVSFACHDCEEELEEEGLGYEGGGVVADRSTGALWIPGAGTWVGQPRLAPTGLFASVSRSEGGDVGGAQVSFWRVNLGKALGVGGLGLKLEDGEDDRFCIERSCIPPQAAVSFWSGPSINLGKVLTGSAADLIGGAIAYRPSLGDLYVKLELESMPRTPALAAATAGILYGMTFEVDGHPYEIRSVSTGLGAHGETTAVFGLFDCSTDELVCTKVKDLKGGFGTTGERITFSVPLEGLRVQNGSEILNVQAFTALGGYGAGATKILDSVRMK